MENFSEDLNTAIITTKYVLEESRPILYIYHFEEDGMWQFSGDEDCSDEDYMVISLEEVIKMDTSILLVADMQLGYYACRKSISEEWIVNVIEE